MYHMNHAIWFTIVSSLFKAQSKISELFDETDFKSAVSEIMVRTKNGSNDDSPVVQKLREQLERSSTEIFPFFEACLRNFMKYFMTHTSAVCHDSYNAVCTMYLADKAVDMEFSHVHRTLITYTLFMDKTVNCKRKKSPLS